MLSKKNYFNLFSFVIQICTVYIRFRWNFILVNAFEWNGEIVIDLQILIDNFIIAITWLLQLNFLELNWKPLLQESVDSPFML